jgi:hypothetical protein
MSVRVSEYACEAPAAEEGAADGEEYRDDEWVWD